MTAALTDSDLARIDDVLNLLSRAGLELAPDIEPSDVEDAVADDAPTFRAYPLTSVAGLIDPDGTPLLRGAVVSSADIDDAPRSTEEFVAVVERFAGAAGAQATDVAVMPDPGADGLTGSVRIRFGMWDIADINYDFTDASLAGRDFELDVIAAALPIDASAATFPTPDGHNVTLFIPADADPAAVDELFAAIESEFDADLDPDSDPAH